MLAPHGGESVSSAGIPASRPALLRQPAFLAVTAAAALVQASHAVYYGFSTIEWQAAGLGGRAIGALWALGVLAEIALFAVSGRMPIASTTLLLAGACGAVVRWSAMALDPPTVLLPVLQCLHALSFGATHLGAVSFMARAAPAGSAATAQGYLAVALGLVMAVTMGISGALYARWGGLAYLAMAIAAAAGGVCALAARRLTSWQDG
jgi:PPP family 3-phenylpropionic acid transporter